MAGGGRGRGEGGSEGSGCAEGPLTEVRLHQSNSMQNYQPAARESQGFQSENRRIYFFSLSFLSAKSQQAVEQQGQAADNQIRHLVFLLQTTAGTSLSLLTGV